MLLRRSYAICLLCSILLSSCSSPSPEAYREEGRAATKSIIKELQQIHSRDELIHRKETLERLWCRLTETMIAARKLQESNPNGRCPPITLADHQLSDKLRNEMTRLYHIPGARKIVEESQRNALNKLDIYEKQLIKRKKGT